MGLEQLIHLLHAAGFSQAALLALYFFLRRQRPGNIYESLLLSSVALSIGFGYLYESRTILHWPHLARFGFTIVALIGPFFYLSARARSRADNRLRWFDLWLWIVPVATLLYLLPFHLSPVEHKLRYLREDLVQIHFDCVVLLYLSMLNNLAAVGLSLWQMYRTGARLLSDENRRGNLWFHAVPLAILLGAGLVSAFDPNLLNSGLFSGLASLLVLGRSYLLLYRQERDDPDATADTLYPAAARYQKALLSSEFVHQQGKRIQSYLDEEQPYLEPDFQLNDIARYLDLSAVQTSQILNRHFQQSFTQLARTCRVRAVQAAFRERGPNNATILEVALDCGFNSKSAFNLAFKTVTGQTPGEWRASVIVHTAAHD